MCQVVNVVLHLTNVLSTKVVFKYGPVSSIPALKATMCMYIVTDSKRVGLN